MKRIIKEILSKKGRILWILAAILAFASFFKFSSSGSMDREVEILEKKIHKRQGLLERYSIAALEKPDTAFLSFNDFPEDMVIYRYCKDSLDSWFLQSWINQFPVSSDDIEQITFAYWISHLNSKSVTNTPLAYASDTEQYMNLGSAWYIVKMYMKEDMRIISALMVQTDYPTENSMLKNSINPRFSVKKHFSIVPVTYDESYVISGKDGGVLFSVLKILPAFGNESSLLLRWLAIVFALAALFVNLYYDRNFGNFLLTAGSLVIIKYVVSYQTSLLGTELELFSPSLYAD